MTCTKVRYGSRRRAKLAARQQPGKPGLWPYKCREDGFWHLTSQTTAQKTFWRRIDRSRDL